MHKLLSAFLLTLNEDLGMNQTRNSRVFSITMMVFIMLIPLMLSYKVSDAGLITQQVLLMLMAISGAVLLGLNKQQLVVTKPKFLMGSMVFLVCYLFSYTYSLNQVEALNWISKIGGYVGLLVVLALADQNNLLEMKWIRRGVFVCLLLSVISFWIEVLLLYNSGTSLFMEKNLYQINTLYGNKNLYASFVFLSVVLVYPLVFESKKLFSGLVIVVLLISIASIFFIQTKAVILGILIAALALLWPFLRFMTRKNKRLSSMFLIGMVLIFLLALVFILTHQDKFYVLLNRDTFHERLMLWTNTLQLIVKHPILGIGAGNWQIFFPSEGLDKFGTTNYLITDGFLTFQRPHNDYLWIWSEAGLLAFVLYVFLLVWTLLIQIKRLRGIDNTTAFMHQLVMAGGWIGYMVIAFFDFPLERASHQILFCLLAVDLSSSYSPPRINLKKVYLVPLFIVLFASTFIQLKRFQSESGMKRIFSLYEHSDWQGMMREYLYVRNNYYSLDPFSIPVAWYMGVAKLGMNDTSGALPFFRLAYHENPYQIHVLNNLAGNIERLGRHDSAVYYYDKALHISTFQPDVRLNRAASLYNAKRLTEAFNAIIAFPFDSTSTQSQMYMRAIVSDYLFQQLSAGDTLLNKGLAQTLVNYPDSIWVYHLQFSQQHLNFKNQIYPLMFK